MALARPAGDARARMAFVGADGDRAAIVTDNDQVSEVGW